jgi:hypothetical protein
MSHQDAYETANSRRVWLYKMSAAASLAAGMLMILAIISLITTIFQPIAKDWLSSLQDNWLILIFKLHSGFNGVTIDQLHFFSYLDMVILVCVAVTHIGLYTALRKTSKILSILALAQPLLGIIIFIVTASTGRSTVMGAGLVASIAMLRNNAFKKIDAFTGFFAWLLVLAGDLTAGVIPPSNLVAALFGIGYILLPIWFFMIARALFQMGVGILKSPV